MSSSDESDDSADDGPHYSAMKQPPLIKQLKKILDEYPDDGQILKEIIQNAEDAEASFMEIMYDGRFVNASDVSKTEKPFRKYFKGPALCVYNDALFTKEDWEGIQMINSSIKEFDPVKIGRFGLGFKSVFHITDYPMIISKGKMLIIDPHQTNSERVCVLMSLKKIKKYTEEIDISDCLSSLDGVFGFSKATLDSGHYQGTLFRFPLRDKPTQLSDNVYDEGKIIDLFKAFQSEASVELLFLKFLERINLYSKDATELYCRENAPFFTVHISDSCLNDARKKRQQLHSRMKSFGSCFADESFVVNFHLTICTNDFTGGSCEKEWLVIHCLKGGAVSEEIKALSKDESLSYSPYVSIALPIKDEEEFKGHVFCLMPLPLQDESLTGYPVHVNGYFALTQNRRHVKWPTADQTRNKAHTDKAIRWNRCLVIEVLADLYFCLIQQVLQKCRESNNSSNMISLFYRCIPDYTKITSHWELLLNPLFSRLLQIEFLFTENNDGRWIKAADAVFNIFKEDISEDVKEAVLHLMRLNMVNLVEVPVHITSMLHFRNCAVQKLTAKFVIQFLRSDQRYKTMPHKEKISILKFILMGHKESKLDGLELLPLENGKFGTFDKRKREKQRVIVCDGESELFPGQEEMFCRQDLETGIYKSLYEMAQNGEFQLCVFDDLAADDIASLLLETIRKLIGKTSDQSLHWKTSGNETTGKKWLLKVWKLLHNYNLREFSHLHLMPNTSGKDLLCKISTKFVLKSQHGYKDLSKPVCNALEYLDICILDSLPKAILDHDDIPEYVYFPTVDNIFKMLELIQSNTNHGPSIKKFNKKSTEEERIEFVKFIATQPFTNSTVSNILSKLEIFKERPTGRFVSSSEVAIIAETNSLPIKYHKVSLECGDQNYRNLACSLQVKFISLDEIVVDILSCMQKGTQYTHAEVAKMVKFVMSNLKTFRDKEFITNIVKTIKFVLSVSGQMKKASDLFDPENDILKAIIVDHDNFPDVKKSPVTVKQLRKLGLKSPDNLKGEDLLKCAKHIESNPNDVTEWNRSDKILACLQNNPSLLRSHIGNSTLSDKLLNIHFIKACERIPSFPSQLPWFEGSLQLCKPVDLHDPKYCNLIGCVLPILPICPQSEISKAFGWNRKPSVKKVIDQLLVLIEIYDDRYKPQLLPLISDIYSYLAERNEEFSSCNRLKEEKWIWTGFGFESAENVILKTENTDISLNPYVYPLPVELKDEKRQQFFRKMNILPCQNHDLYIRLLHRIHSKYENYANEFEAKTDLDLVVKILNKLKEIKDINCRNVLVPVHSPNTGKVILKTVTECNYCNDDWLKGVAEEEGEEIYYVHPNISHDTAIKLGVPSLTDRLLECTEGIEEWGQTEPLTRRLKNLLKDYKDGFSVPKEIVQNADDAGATKVCFMYDERENEKYKTKLLNDKMSSCQGPALWAFNDAVFSQKDLQNITKLSGATKEEDSSKIGKFGLGFCSVYNLTDVPSFVTGDQIVIFDPHTTYLGSALRNKNQPGIKIDMRVNQALLKRMSSQFVPYNGVFDCRLNPEKGQTTFNGTLFRFPLRTKEQAISSEICDTVYNREEMTRLLKIFVEACGNLLLFSQNVCQIEFFYLPSSATDPSDAAMLCSINKNIFHCIERPLGKRPYAHKRLSVLKDVSRSFSKKGEKGNLCSIEMSVLQEISVKLDAKLTEFGIKGKSSCSDWFITWATGTGDSKNMTLNCSRKGILPLGSVACLVEEIEEGCYRTCSLNQSPFGFYQTSHVFCYLPLPIETPFSVHINGSFAVSSDRRRLSCQTTDDKDSFDSEWNAALISDAVCNAYITFLEHLSFLRIDYKEHYYQQWPIQETAQENLRHLKNSFFKKIADETKKYTVFRRLDKTACLNQCRFLDPNLMETDFAETAFEMCVQKLDNAEITMIQLPNVIVDCFKNVGCGASVNQRILNLVTFYSSLVFPNLLDPSLDKSTKNKLILHAIDICNHSEELFDLLQMQCCIPTSPNGTYRRPCDIVDVNGKVKALFNIEDERFLDSTELEYIKPDRLATLRKMRMITDELPDELLLERAHSIQILQKTSYVQALERCKVFISYINSEHWSIETNQRLFCELQQIQFLAVKQKPVEWKWKWGGEITSAVLPSVNDEGLHLQCCFECPSKLYAPSVWELVCCSHPIVDKAILPLNFSSSLMEKLGVLTECNLSFQIVLENLVLLSRIDCSDDKDSTNVEMLEKITLSIYKYLDKLYTASLAKEANENLFEQITDTFKDEKLICLEGTFVTPSQTVVNMSEDCSPYIYRLNSSVHLKKLKGLFRLLRIDDICSTKKLLDILNTLRKQYGSQPMTDETVKLYVKLLKVLAESIKVENITANYFEDLHIPDTKGVLCPIKTLCVDDVTVTSMETMKFTHPSISFEIAFALKINSKRDKKIEVCSKPIELYSKSFGQHEELITRIKRILSGYPCDFGILKELLQNADDAKASEVHIAIDFTHHNTDNLFSDSWKPLQGPALLVYNDSSFSEADIKGIQNLGIGSKGDDPTKTGQYGVGFNAVYHLTDVPSFLTRGPDVETTEILCVMDPHCRFVPNATKENPGRQYFNTGVLRNDYPNVFSCYRDELLMNKNNHGTIFRLPLRSHVFASNSKISTTVINEESVKKLIYTFQEELREILLFVNNVKTIRLSEIVNDSIHERYSVQVQISESDESKRRAFYRHVKDYSQDIRQSRNPECVQALEATYTIKVCDSSNEEDSWLIISRIGFSGRHKLPENVAKAYNEGELGVLPRGGIALNISNLLQEAYTTNARAFCFLPLPIQIGLPVNVNGHFVLDHEARRNLWTEDCEGYRSAWNKHLMHDVIAPSYVSALQVLWNTFGFTGNEVLNEDKLRNILKVYYSYWPDVAHACNEYFRFLACSVYQWICTNEAKLFPCYKMVGTNEATVKLYPLFSSTMHFPCVFSTTKNEQQVEYSFTDTNLIQTCKDLGVKLLETPTFIISSLKEASIYVTEMSPDFFITFLKSFSNADYDRCQIGAINQPVSQTTLHSVANVVTCLKYCIQSPTFEAQVDGLPLCLTDSSILRVFSSDNPIFCSMYCHLLKESSDSFLHRKLVGLLSSSVTVTKILDIPAFSELLYGTLSAEKYRTHIKDVVWNPNSDSVPNKTWIEGVWDFLHSTVIGHLKGDNKIKPSNTCRTVQELLNPLLPWCLIPCTYEPVNENCDNYNPVLFPLNKATSVMDISTFTGDLKKALVKLSLPCLDNLVHNDRGGILSQIIVIHGSPAFLLEYLYQHKDEIISKNLKMRECYVIMEFLFEHLDSVINESEENVIIEKIKAIPLHVNLNGHNIAIQGHSNVLVLDSAVSRGILTDGIETWAEKSRTILLKTSENLKTLYAKLGVTTEDLTAIDVYTNYLLPKFTCLPRIHHLIHLKHIQDELLAKASDFNKKQENLIQVLKNVTFVPDTQNVLYTASHFKSPFIPLIKEMCVLEDFPGEPFSAVSWQYLLDMAGIQNVVTTDMLLQFAKMIERRGNTAVTEDIKHKSNMLIYHILNREGVEKEGILRQLSKVKFILPLTIDTWKNRIFKQPEETLICYYESVPEMHKDLCWTTCSILPNYANPQLHSWKFQSINQVLDQLGVRKEPQLESVLHHVQNVCDSLKLLADIHKLESNVLLIQEFMVKLYAWLTKHREKDVELLRMCLVQKPIVFIPKSKSFVRCDRIVKSLTIKEIKPYLMEAPEEYGAYFKLFEQLGMNTHTNICNFIKVLAHLKDDVCEHELNVNELKIVQRALRQICHFLPRLTDDETKNLSSMDALYLPSRNKFLINAKSIVLSDNRSYEEKIGNDIGMPYMMNLTDLEIFTSGSVVLDFKKLPTNLQPNILSDLISKELNEEILVFRNGEKGRQLHDFIVSPQFIEAAVRITVYCREKLSHHLDRQQIDVDKIISSLENLQIFQDDSIELKLVFRGKTVGHSKTSCYYYAKKQDSGEKEHIILCAFDDKTIRQWLVENCRKLGLALRSCTDNIFTDNEGLLLKIFYYIDNPDEISRALDVEDIPQYSIANKFTHSIFPPAGTRIHPDWHCYLDNSFTDFDVGEYVGLILSEETFEENKFIPALYIYAIILEKCETLEKSPLANTICCYKVDVGNEEIKTKKAFELFKFSRNTHDTSTDMAPFLDIADGPKDERNLDDILKDIKEKIKAAWTRPEDERKSIIRRLYKKWHPDKNHGNEEVATKVFQFLKNAVYKMENGQDLDTGTSENFEPPRGSFFSSCFRTWDQDTRHDASRGKRQRRRGGSSGNTRRQPKEPVPSYHEGRQWLRQAKVDFTGIMEFKPHALTGPNFNLICMLCYQSVEKALKALHYTKDANSVPNTHVLRELTIGLDRDIVVLVNSLTQLLGELEQMMYPNRLSLPKIPSDMYQETTATNAIDLTKELLDLIADRLE